MTISRFGVFEQCKNKFARGLHLELKNFVQTWYKLKMMVYMEKGSM
jgi:hypothetical protein